MLACNEINYSIQNRNLIQNINQDFEPGKFYAILGPNGAGKSTLLKALTQEIKPTSGEILWQKKELNQYNLKYWSQNRGILNQWNAISMGFTNNEIVLMGRYPYFNNTPHEEDISIVMNNMLKTQTLHLGKRFYDNLSGGEKQRIHLSRVLSQITNQNDTPVILVLDEPLNNLDIKHQQNILQCAQDIAHDGNIVIAVLHDLNLASSFADEIILMNKGEIIANGTAKDVYDEELLSACYDIPVLIHSHPKSGAPIVFFETKTTIKKENKINKKEVLWK